MTDLLLRIPAAWVYIAQSLITSGELLASGFRDAFKTLKT